MFVRAYLRASTSEQDASRARGALDAFAAEQGLRIAARYVENESGAKLHRPELFRLLADCAPGDVLLVEQVDRLSRLTSPDWLKLRAEIDTRQVRIVALDLPTSWSLATPGDEFTGRMFAAVNNMMLDVLGAVARKDYEDRRRRQFEGTARAKAAGLYKGRPENKPRNTVIATMLRDGRTWREVMDATGCSRTLLAKIARDHRSKQDNSPQMPSDFHLPALEVDPCPVRAISLDI
jgi:DNA invertase Pin-like site-specific DNA recombinase